MKEVYLADTKCCACWPADGQPFRQTQATLQLWLQFNHLICGDQMSHNAKGHAVFKSQLNRECARTTGPEQKNQYLKVLSTYVDLRSEVLWTTTNNCFNNTTNQNLAFCRQPNLTAQSTSHGPN